MREVANRSYRSLRRLTGIIIPMSVRRLLVILSGILLISLLLSACKKSSSSPTSTSAGGESTATTIASPEPTSTALPPTATPIPLAAVVNGEEITLAELQAEVMRYQASHTITVTVLASDTNTIVINDLIDQTLLAQGASQNGFTVDDAVVQSRIKSLEDQLGGNQALEEWRSAHGYSADDFLRALKRSIGAAWMRDHIASSVGETAEEVHVLQILVLTSAEAQQIYSRLQAGEAFLDIVAEYDPMTRGDLGWFPRGYLSDPKIEEAAFALQPGQYSSVIETDIGFHILYMLERDNSHALQPDARRALQVRAIQDWINESKTKSDIQIMIP